ncbi:MAG: FkbM family methyltransferase [Candidatus Omnitrophota bacterium]|nr:MAG: FkbM family methyltransferase [Candidatus Omnitrophota bacterium]
MFKILRHLLPEFVYRHLHFKGKFKVKIKKNHFYIHHFGYLCENELFWRGLSKEMKVWAEMCQEADVILDIGANTGIFSLIAKAVNPKASVYAFEPVPRVIKKLRANCMLNNFNIQCLEVAVSDYDGVGEFYEEPLEHLYSATLAPHNSLKNSMKTEVRVTRLDSFIEKEKIRPDLIKIDVEGCEFKVLEGMGKSLRPKILLENHSNISLGDDWQSIDNKGHYIKNWKIQS